MAAFDANRIGPTLCAAMLSALFLVAGRPGWVAADEPARTKAKESSADSAADGVTVNKIGMRMVLIRPGEFLMGSPDSEPGHASAERQHKVRISKPFYFGQTKVTRGEFRQFVEASGYRTEPETDGKGGLGYNSAEKKAEQADRYNWRNTGFEQTDDHPVVNVTWNDAKRFCEWLSSRDGRAYRLPSEAEWEFACRAGTQTVFHGGNDPEELVRFGNIADVAGREVFKDWTITTKSRDGFVFTSPVGKFKPNALGLFDMHGNACEWCSDWYDAEYYSRSPADDPAGPATGSRRANRGGCWGSPAGTCRSASRHAYDPTARHYGIGFRVAAAPE